MELTQIQTKDYLLLINEKAEIFQMDFYLDVDRDTVARATLTLDQYSGCKKIVAYRALTKEAKELDGIPLIPNPFEEVDIKELGKQRAIDRKWHPNSMETRRVANEIISAVEYGYKVQQSKQFSLEDINAAFNAAREKYTGYQGYVYDSANEYISEVLNNQSLSTQQLPKEFIPETEVDPTNRNNWYIDCPSGKYWEDKPVPPSPDRLYTNGTRRLKTITNAEGKLQLVGTYKY